MQSIFFQPFSPEMVNRFFQRVSAATPGLGSGFLKASQADSKLSFFVSFEFFYAFMVIF